MTHIGQNSDIIAQINAFDSNTSEVVSSIKKVTKTMDALIAFDDCPSKLRASIASIKTSLQRDVGAALLNANTPDVYSRNISHEDEMRLALKLMEISRSAIGQIVAMEAPIQSEAIHNRAIANMIRHTMPLESIVKRPLHPLHTDTIGTYRGSRVLSKKSLPKTVGDIDVFPL